MRPLRVLFGFSILFNFQGPGRRFQVSSSAPLVLGAGRSLWRSYIISRRAQSVNPFFQSFFKFFFPLFILYPMLLIPTFLPRFPAFSANFSKKLFLFIFKTAFLKLPHFPLRLLLFLHFASSSRPSHPYSPSCCKAAPHSPLLSLSMLLPPNGGSFSCTPSLQL